MLHPRGERIGIVETGDSGEWTGKVLWHRHLPGGYLAKAYASVYGGIFWINRLRNGGVHGQAGWFSVCARSLGPFWTRKVNMVGRGGSRSG
jgi:hypothetical protein